VQKKYQCVPTAVLYLEWQVNKSTKALMSGLLTCKSKNTQGLLPWEVPTIITSSQAFPIWKASPGSISQSLWSRYSIPLVDLFSCQEVGLQKD